MKAIQIFILLTLCCLAVSAQQQVAFTQYMFNGMAINPGYIGSHGALSASALSRWQWAGVEGAPRTQTVAVHSPVPTRNIGLGLQLTRDEIAATKMTSFMLGYSYQVVMGHGILSMGLQGGMQNYRTDLSSLYTINADQSFSQDQSGMKPNFGAGAFYYNPVFYLGVSAPTLFNNSVEAGGEEIFTQARHYFLTTGAVFAVSEQVKLKPNVLVKAVEGAPMSVDYNLNVFFYDILSLGVSIRPPESINFLMEMKVNQKFTIGYAYDHIIDANLGNMSASSHEILLNYRLKWFKEKIVTPKYF